MSLDHSRVCIIFNPRSGGGKTAALRERIEREAKQWFSNVVVRATESPGHGVELAAVAAKEGFQRILSVGGDGTAHEVVNGLMSVPKEIRPQLAVIPSGTGSDLVKSLRIPKDFSESMRIAAQGMYQPVDVLRITVRAIDGSKDILCFGINVCGFGIAGDVVRNANSSSKKLGGTITFALATLKALRIYRPAESVVQWKEPDGSNGKWTGELLVGWIANGRYCGGGMWVGGHGTMDDGEAVLTIIPKMPVRSLVLNGHRLYDGSLADIPGAVHVPVRSMELSVLTPTTVGLDVDGEQPGVLPMKVEVLPKELVLNGLFE